MVFLKRYTVAFSFFFSLTVFPLSAKTVEIINLKNRSVNFSIWSFKNSTPRKTYSGNLKKGSNVFSFEELKLPTDILTGTFGIKVGQDYVKAFFEEEQSEIYLTIDKKNKLSFLPKDVVNYNLQHEITKTDAIHKGIRQIDKSKKPDLAKREHLLHLYESIRKHEKEKLDLSPEARKYLEVSHFTIDYSTSFKDIQDFSKKQLEHFFDIFNPADTDLQHTLVPSTKIIEYLSFIVQAGLNNNGFKRALDTYLQYAMMDSEMYDYTIEEMTKMIPRVAHDPVVLEYLDRTYSPTSCDYDSKFYLAREERLELYERMAVGKVAPNFCWKNKAKELCLSNIKSEYTVVLFWSSTCGHCTKNVPLIFEKIGKNSPKVSIVAVSLDRIEGNWRKFYTSKKLQGWHHIFHKKIKTNMSRLYGVPGTPYYVILDKNKKILEKTHSTSRLYSVLGIY